MEPLHTIFTFAMVMAAALTGLHAYHHNRLPFYTTSIAYGYLLEQLVILAFRDYNYPVEAYPLTFFDVPLAISFGWSAILYTGYILAHRFNFSKTRIPIFAALFAIHLDLAGDVVAANLGFWVWLDGGAWFGVPLTNFFGWYSVALLFTGCYLLFTTYITNEWLAALVAVPSSVVLLLGVLQAWKVFIEPSLSAQVIALGVLFFSSAMWLFLSDYTPRPVPLTLRATLGILHGFFFLLYILTGMVVNPQYQALLPVSLGAVIVGVTIAEQPSFRYVDTRLERGKQHLSRLFSLR